MSEQLERLSVGVDLPLREKRAKVLGVLALEQLAVVSTVGRPNPARCYPGITQDAPESALVAFTQDDELKLYFQTGRHTRKAANLARNPYVSFVINHATGDTPYPNVTVQYQGKANQLEAPEDLEVCKERFVAKDSPTTEKYFNDPSAVFFRVDPIWVGCSDYSTEPPQVLEIDFQGSDAAEPAR